VVRLFIGQNYNKKNTGIDLKTAPQTTTNGILIIDA